MRGRAREERQHRRRRVGRVRRAEGLRRQEGQRALVRRGSQLVLELPQAQANVLRPNSCNMPIFMITNRLRWLSFGGDYLRRMDTKFKVSFMVLVSSDVSP